MTDLRVALRPPYPVRFRDSFRQIWDCLLEDQGDRRLLLVVDERVEVACPRLWRGLPARQRRHVVRVRGGEGIKNWGGLRRLVAEAMALGVDRQTLVVAVGGGTVGDLAGLFAATYMRGLDWCPVATTVVAMADSAIGGKTAINAGKIKNLIGSFHQPVAVYAPLEALASLPRRHRVAGLAEVVKCGMIRDRKLFSALEAAPTPLNAPPADPWAEILVRAARVKARIVAADPKEGGARALLNFGHTLGHALETTVRPRLHHGEAVALGMIGATAMSVDRGLAPAGSWKRLLDLLERLGLPTDHPGIDVEAVMAALRFDKKAAASRTRMVLTEGIGSASFGHTADRASLVSTIRSLQRPAGRSGRANDV